jgi:hypothetical protein
MTSLSELEAHLDSDVRRALTTVMPRLEEPITPSATEHAQVGDIVVDVERPSHQTRRRPAGGFAWAVAVLIVVTGGVWWVSASQRTTPTAPTGSVSDVPHATDQLVTTPVTSAGETTSTSATQPPSTTNWPLDGLDPLVAARTVSIAAVIGPTPDESADLVIAGAILENECLRDGGVAPPVLTTQDHQLARQAAVAELRSITDFLTGSGLDFIAANGYDARQTTDPTHREIAADSPESELLVAGCGGADNDLRPGLAEEQLTRLTELGAEWGYQRIRPDQDAEYASRYAIYEDCMHSAGLATMDRDNAETNPIVPFLGGEAPTADELAYARHDVDCRTSAELPTAYVEAVSPLVGEFVAEQAAALAAVDAERIIALDLARTVLTDHDIEPFTQ